jgi:hypothetical protein
MDRGTTLHPDGAIPDNQSLIALQCRPPPAIMVYPPQTSPNFTYSNAWAILAAGNSHPIPQIR